MSDFIGPKATIDLKAIQDNYATISEFVGHDVVASAVVKSDSYGLGASRVSKALYEKGCRDFWVAYLIEALEIRKVLPIDANIYYLQGFQESDIEDIKGSHIIPVINSLEDFEKISGNGIEFVIHVDSGMSRLGLRPEDIDKILPVLKNEKIAYVISHLACSDEKDNSMNLKQKETFDKALSKIREVLNVKAGISATGGALLGKDFSYDMVRIGAFLYGIDVGFEKKPKNVLTLKTSVLQKYMLPAGVSVGYGATYKTSKETKVAIISIGYADGINRTLSNKGIIGFYENERFYKAPIIGKISMDLITCDVSDLPDGLSNPGCFAYLLCDEYSINDMAIDAGTIPYEILTSLNLKSKRFCIEYID